MLGVCVFVPWQKTRFLGEYITNIDIPPNIFFVVSIFFFEFRNISGVWGFVCIMGELAGEGCVAVSVAVSTSDK